MFLPVTFTISPIHSHLTFFCDEKFLNNIFTLFISHFSQRGRNSELFVDYCTTICSMFPPVTFTFYPIHSHFTFFFLSKISLKPFFLALMDHIKLFSERKKFWTICWLLKYVPPLTRTISPIHSHFNSPKL